MTLNGLKLLDCDESSRAWYEDRFGAEALKDSQKRGCIIDAAASDVCLYLIGAKSEEDYLAIEQKFPGYDGHAIFERD